MRKSVIVSVLVVVVIGLAVPAAFSATCSIISPTSCVAGVCTARVSNINTTTFASVTLSSAFQANCSPTGSFTLLTNGGTALLRGTKTVAATAPVCSWNCTGISIIFDASDGLPVELMSFSVDE